VWKRNKKYPGIAMSRSIGDLVASTLGVICTPDILEHNIDSSSKCILLASDGVWDHLSYEKLRGILEKSYDVKDLRKKILNDSIKMWRTIGLARDDISILVLVFN
jgi:serine/threonine protein phosphatase PrpC